MAPIRSTLLLALIATVLLGATAPARAQEGWLSQELARLAALPHTLQAVSSNAWLQIPVRDQRIHRILEETYRTEARPRLDALASAARPDLERELDAVLNNLRYDDLHATSAKQPLSYCSWIGAARPDGCHCPRRNTP